MRKYKFKISETNYIKFTQKEYDEFKSVQYIDDNSKGEIIPIKRDFDNNRSMCYGRKKNSNTNCTY